MSFDKVFAAFANRTSQAAGSPWTFCACLALVLLWALSGPVFGFSETWQLVINTGTTIITFLMVFLIQNTQNRDNAAVQAKLDDLILTSAAENDFVGIERLTDRELKVLRERCEARSKAHRNLGERLDAEAERRATRRRRKPTAVRKRAAKAA
ncbi:MAG: low affinity iron permease family protein [Phenylobacterium sp.]|uniref:low affinity iron permease family protein n=1 Tax=Phenylobacterium sp. TaxID=1871053 RepID=UPI002600BFE5|nr:low affinity iron permease family protein [Phenylobacterium sp.]MBI1199913.1 low affinity iron permease family protein [Phenylobacterium sp.]